MNKKIVTIGVAALLATVTFAQEQPKKDFYSGGEFSIDLGAQYQVAKNGSDLFNSTLKGGDWAYTIGANYYFTEYLGMGFDLYMLEPGANQHPTTEDPLSGDGESNELIKATNLKLLLRYPMGRFAPYAIAGGGYDYHVDKVTATAGAGLEYRIANGLGVFGEALNTWTASESNLVQFRMGFRFCNW